MSEFETTDFYLACYLRCAGYQLTDARRDGKQVTFILRDGPNRHRDVIRFFLNEGSVRPLAFVHSIKEMKALIHAAR